MNLIRSIDERLMQSSAPNSRWRMPTWSLPKPTNFQVQITGGDQTQDAVRNRSTASIDEYIAALVPSRGGAEAQELVSAYVFDAEQAAGDEPKDWVKE
jgi:hypothetical protein